MTGDTKTAADVRRRGKDPEAEASGTRKKCTVAKTLSESEAARPARIGLVDRFGFD